MPLEQFIAEAVAQLTIEVGGEAIKQRYGWKGCVVAILLIVALIAIIIWYVRG